MNVSKKELQVALIFWFNPNYPKLSFTTNKPLVVKANELLLLYSQQHWWEKRKGKKEKESSLSFWNNIDIQQKDK